MRKYQKWTQKEIDIVEAGIDAGKSYVEIGEELNRSSENVRSLARRKNFKNLRENVQATRSKTSLTERLLEYLKRPKRQGLGFTINELADALNVAPKHIQKAIKDLKEQNITIEVRQENVELSTTVQPKDKPIEVIAKKFFGSSGKVIRFGAIADTHLASKYARLDVLNALYDVFENEGLQKVFLCGNNIDGESRYNQYDLLVRGVEGQSKYFIENLPQRQGIVTQFITGDDHEGWYIQREHINIGQYIEDMAKRMGRNDIQYIGHMERDIEIKGTKTSQIIRLIHGGGGSTYADSYTSQKYAESLQSGEKPRIVLVGHFHKFNFDYPREICIIQVGCVEDQTPYMRKKKILAHVGGTIVTLHQDDDGIINRCMVEWIPFYNKKFYEYKW
jgi:predicted phosphodiesterase